MVFYCISFLLVAFTITVFAYSLCYSAKKSDEQAEKLFKEEKKDGD